MKTTLYRIRQKTPCAEGWEKLLLNLGKTKPDDEELPLVTILGSNGIEDAIWCLRAVDNSDRDARHFAVWCARRWEKRLTSQDSINALEVAAKYADGLVPNLALMEARRLVRAAAQSAYWSGPQSVAFYAAGPSACGAAWDVSMRVGWAEGWAPICSMFTSMCNGNAPWQTHI
jgi:hypothetical protein